MTQQIRDILHFEDKKYRLNNFILESFFFNNPKLRPYANGGTALRRGYIATFSIKDEKLTLINLETFSNDDTYLKIISILKKTFNGEKICDWYSGLIRIDDTKGLYDEEKKDFTFIFLEFHKGTYIGKRVMNYFELQNFKSDQFRKFKATADYRTLYNNFLKSNIGAYEIDTIIINNILKYIPEVY